MRKYQLIYINKENKEVVLDTFNSIFDAEYRTRGNLYEGLYVVDREPYELTRELVRVEHRYYDNAFYMHNKYTYKGFEFTLISNVSDTDRTQYYSGVYLENDKRIEGKPYFIVETKKLGESIRNMQRPENLIAALDKLIEQQR